MSSFRLDIESLRFFMPASGDRPAAPVDSLERHGLTSARQRLLQSRANTARAKVFSKAKHGGNVTVLDTAHEKVAFSRDASQCMATDSELAKVLASIEALEKKRAEIFSARKSFQLLAKTTQSRQSESASKHASSFHIEELSASKEAVSQQEAARETFKDDVAGIICMWDLMGECADPECRFAHTR